MPLRKIATTFVSKFIAAFFNLLLLYFTIKYMGATQRGYITLLILNLSFVMLAAEWVAGPVLVYFFAHHNTSRLLKIAYIWILLVCVLSLIILSFFSFQFSIFAFIVLCFFQCAISLNNQLLIGFGKISNQNLIQTIQPFFTLIFTLFFIYLGYCNVNYFLISFLTSSIVTFIIQQFFVKFFQFKNQSADVTTFEVVKKGSYTTASNIAHLITNRVSYFYINSLLGAAALGVYSAAISLSEAVLMAASSAGVVHYSNITNSKDVNQNQSQTILFAKYSLAITFFVFIIIYFIPNHFFTELLGKDFTEVKQFILIFLPGIIALSITHIFTHYFSGIGNFRTPFFASLFSCILVGTFAKYSLLQFKQSGLLMLTSIGLVFQAIILITVFKLERNKYLQKKL